MQISICNDDVDDPDTSLCDEEIDVYELEEIPGLNQIDNQLY